MPTKKVQELRLQLEELQLELESDKKRYSDLNGKYEQLEEEHILIKAQLTTDKENLQSSLDYNRNIMNDREAELRNLRKEKIDLSRKLVEATSKANALDGQSLRITTLQYEKNRIKMTLDERDQQISQLRDENDMNKDVCSQMKREVMLKYADLTGLLYYLKNTYLRSKNLNESSPTLNELTRLKTR